MRHPSSRIQLSELVVQLVLTYLVPNSELRKPGFAVKVLKHNLTAAWAGLGKSAQMTSAAVCMLTAAFSVRAAVLLFSC